MRQDNQTLNGAFGEFVIDLSCGLKRGLLIPRLRFSFLSSVSLVKAEPRNCTKQEESDCISIFQLFLGFGCGLMLHLLLLLPLIGIMRQWCFCLVWESLYNLRFLFNCAATGLVPNVDYCHNAKMHSCGNAVCVLFPDYLELQTGSSYYPYCPLNL